MKTTHTDSEGFMVINSTNNVYAPENNHAIPRAPFSAPVDSVDYAHDYANALAALPLCPSPACGCAARTRIGCGECVAAINEALMVIARKTIREGQTYSEVVRAVAADWRTITKRDPQI